MTLAPHYTALHSTRLVWQKIRILPRGTSVTQARLHQNSVARAPQRRFYCDNVASSATKKKRKPCLRREGQHCVAGPSVVDPELEDAVGVGDGEGGAVEAPSAGLERDAFVRVQHHELHLPINAYGAFAKGLIGVKFGRVSLQSVSYRIQ